MRRVLLLAVAAAAGASVLGAANGFASAHAGHDAHRGHHSAAVERFDPHASTGMRGSARIVR